MLSLPPAVEHAKEHCLLSLHRRIRLLLAGLAFAATPCVLERGAVKQRCMFYTALLQNYELPNYIKKTFLRNEGNLAYKVRTIS